MNLLFYCLFDIKKTIQPGSFLKIFCINLEIVDSVDSVDRVVFCVDKLFIMSSNHCDDVSSVDSTVCERVTRSGRRYGGGKSNGGV